MNSLKFRLVLLAALSLGLTHAIAADPAPRFDPFARTNLVAWCIVPFDAKKRGPEERAQMLDRLGLRQLAYDWRDEHIPTFDAEIETMKRHGIAVTAWWFPASTNGTARVILDALARHKVPAQLWVSLGDPAPNGDQAEKIRRATATLRPIAEEAAKLGGQLALYNHGGWFGEPENQIAIIAALRLPNVGLVYNFHHGHDHLARFPELFRLMQPHLLAINLNGMVKGGDKAGKKILTLGQGDEDLALLRIIRDSGWRGPVGVIDHRPETDSEVTLRENLDGLEKLRTALAKLPPSAKADSSTPAASLSGLAYERRDSREATLKATHEATAKRIQKFRAAPWQMLGAVEAKFASNGAADLAANYAVGGQNLKWSAAPQFADAQWRKFETANGWLARVIEAEQEQEVTLTFSARRALTVRLNGGVLPGEIGPPGWLATQIANINEKVSFYVRLQRGANHLSVRFSEPTDFFFDISPLGATLRKELNERLAKDFPAGGEDYFYKLETITPPPHVVLEIGGMCFLPDGTLAVCTRRGEIWLASGTPASGPERNGSPTQRAGSETGAPRIWRLFASGLQEPLGIIAGKAGEFFVVQRSELTRVADTDGDGRADLFETITAECGVSSTQHAYVFGPVRDSKGNFWGAISGIGVGGSGKYFGWSFRVTPKGEYTPWSSGLRSPNGLCLTPDDELFITDNQGEYMGTSPLHHISKGAFHGHPAGLKWDSTFAAGDKTPIQELAKHRKPPAIIFPYGSMGQSLSQPLVDTTGGKFGPFAGQMFVGDVTKCNVMRVALEKVDGEFQGACFPFRSGFQAGNNRLAFAPDGSLWVGQTDRGWGSIGGRDHGLQRLVWNGRVPLEAQTVKLTREGFEITFTQPLDAATASDPQSWALQHFFYLYRAAYGSPPMDNTPVPVKSATLSADRRTVRLALGELLTGKVYELRFDKLRGADGAEPLHAAAYYTFNRLVKTGVQ